MRVKNVGRVRYMTDETKNIFVSHQHNDADKIESFKDLIDMELI